MTNSAAATWERIDTLTPWKGNPRKNSEAVEPIARSILRFGFGNPILARAENREVIAGHTRLLAVAFLRDHVWDDARGGFRLRSVHDPVFVCPGAPSPGMVPVRLLDLDEGEAHALALADNKLGELAEWDVKGLERELRELREGFTALDGLGWGAGDLAGLLTDIVNPSTTGPKRDEPEVLQAAAATVITGRCEPVLREMEPESFDSCVCDPPYGLSEPPDPFEVLQCWLDGRPYVHPRPGFMGHEWDAFVPGPETWAEVFRVLRPGAHVIAFASTRTVDWLSLALRLAGFEVRDTGSWLHPSGYPKSIDAALAIDRLREDGDRVYLVTEWLADRCDAASVTGRDLDELFGTTAMGAHWTKRRPGLQPASPGCDRFAAICSFLGVEPDPEIADLVAVIEAERGAPGAAFAGRPVIGHEIAVDTSRKRITASSAKTPTRKIARTAAGSDRSAPWQGWGTQLRPLIEPWVVARKPFGRDNGRAVSLAENLLRHGVGAMNIDGCRLQAGDPMWAGPEGTVKHPLGRWPPNIVVCSKPSRGEREAGLEGFPVGPEGLRNPHPTLKPIRLMAWLTRLVTPKGGAVLDPFAGSGSEGCGAAPLGFRYLGIEADENHARVARARIAHWSSVGLDALPAGESEDEP